MSHHNPPLMSEIQDEVNKARETMSKINDLAYKAKLLRKRSSLKPAKEAKIKRELRSGGSKE